MKVNKDIKFNYSLNEAYSKGLRYVLLDNEGNIRHVPCRCKDYFQDVYWSEILKQENVSQYGFKWNGCNNNPISKQEKVKLLLIPDYHDNDLSLNINNIVNFMNIIEKELNIPFTTAEISESDNKDIIITYDNKWSVRPYLLSLMFLLLRIGLHFKGNNLNDIFDYIEDKTEYKNKWLINDKQQTQSLLKQKKLELILKDKILPEQKWSMYTNISLVHDTSGIISYKFDLINNDR